MVRPVRINSMELNKRIVLPTVRLGAVGDFAATERLTAFFEECAEG